MLPAPKGPYSKSGKIPAKTNLHCLEPFLSKGYAKLVYLHFETVAFPQIKKFAYLKNNTALLMLLLKLRHDDATKTLKISGTSLRFAKSISCYWSRNIWLDDGNVRRCKDFNIRVIFLPKQKLHNNVPEHLELFMFSDDKNVAALKGTAENKENQSMET